MNFQTARVSPRKGGHLFASAFRIAVLLALSIPVPLTAQPSFPEEWALADRQMDAKNPADALPYLEKLVRDYPDVVMYRLELAYALYLLERDGRAQYHFQQARGADLTQEQRQAVDITLNRIAARKKWSVRLGFSIEPATNAGKGTAAGSVDVGGLILTIPDNLRSKSATGAVVTAGVTYRARLSSNLEASLSLDTLVKHYKDKALRETLVVGRAGLRWSPARNTFVEGGVLSGTAYAGGRPSNERYGLYGSYVTPVGKRASFRVGMERYRLSYDRFALGDGDRTQLDAQFAYAMSPSAILRTRGHVLHLDSNGALQSGWQGAFSLGSTFAFKGGLVAQVDVTTGLDQRKGVNGFTGARRKDRSFSIDTEFYNSKYQIGPFSPVLRVKFERNKSNEVINTYTNKSLSIGFRTSF